MRVTHLFVVCHMLYVVLIALHVMCLQGDPGLPSTDFERVIDWSVALIGVFSVAIVIGNVSELVSELNSNDSKLRNKLSDLNR